MTNRIGSGVYPAQNFASGLEEYEGRTPEDAATTEIAVSNAVHTIGRLMREERKRRERAGLPDIVLPEEFAAGCAEDQPPRDRRARRSRQPEDVRGVLARLREWRPGRVHAAWAAAFVAVLLWPKAVLLALFAGFIMAVVGVALFGPEILERLRDSITRHVLRRDVARTDSEEEVDLEARPDPFDRCLHDLRS